MDIFSVVILHVDLVLQTRWLRFYSRKGNSIAGGNSFLILTVTVPPTCSNHLQFPSPDSTLDICPPPLTPSFYFWPHLPSLLQDASSEKKKQKKEKQLGLRWVCCVHCHRVNNSIEPFERSTGLRRSLTGA